MHRINTATAVPNQNGAGKAGYTNGDPVHGVPPTQCDAGAFNAIQEEIATTIEGFGIAMDGTGTNNTQLLQALGTTSKGPLGLILSELAMANWSKVTSGVATDLNAVAYWNPSGGVTTGMFIAVGNGGVILTSPDGLTWTPQTSHTAANLRGVAVDNTVGTGGIVAVGDGGAVVVSQDGVTWAAPGTVAPVPGGGGVYHGIAHGGGLWVLVGDREAIVTTAAPFGGAVTWNTVSAGGALTPSFRAVAYGQGTSQPPGSLTGALWVLVGDAATIQTSPDGTIWTAVPAIDIPSAQNLGTICYSPLGFWIAAENHSPGTQALRSVDTLSWTAYGTVGEPILACAVDSRGAVVLVGQQASAGQLAPVVSTHDGVTYTGRVTALGTAALYGVAFGAQAWCAVGAGGVAQVSLRS